MALGECAAGVFSNDRALTKSILDAGENCGERCWELPILPEHSKELKGLYSDSRSTGKVLYCYTEKLGIMLFHRDAKAVHLLQQRF